MAQQHINTGVSANDGSGDKLRQAYLKCEANFNELYTSVAALTPLTPSDMIRSKLVVAANGASGQDITFSADFVGTYTLAILDYNGLGITVTSQVHNKFTITSLTAGNFGYIALIEV